MTTKEQEASLQEIKNKIFAIKSFEPYKPSKQTKVDEDVRKKVLQNDAFAQDIILKRNTLLILFAFLGGETVVIFVFTYFQATGLYRFYLEDWNFRLLLSATLLQITYMLHTAVKHLFPKK
jgi:hypothetical protein